MNIPLLTVEDDTARDVALATESGELGMEVFCLRSLGELAGHLEKDSAPAAVVDIDPEPVRMLSELSGLISQCPGTRFVLLSSVLQNDLILEAMHIGARHFMLKENVRTNLPAVLRRLVLDENDGAFGAGMLVSVLSASGGCGSTTVAVNLANELQLATSEKVLLVDMDSSYGAIGTYFGIGGGYGLADVLKQGGSADPQLVKSASTVYTDDLHVLLSPVSVDFHAPAALEMTSLPTAMEGCRQAYNFTVVDAPHVQPDVAGTLAAISQITLIVLQMTVKDIQYTKDLRSALIRGGVMPSRILLVLNRYRKRNPMVSLKECMHALGEENLELVRNDFRNALRGVNFGKPLSEAAPMSALRKDLRALAHKLAAKVAPAAHKARKK